MSPPAADRTPLGFVERPLARKGTLVSPIGLAAYGIKSTGRATSGVYRRGIERGINLFLWVPAFREMTKAFLELSALERSRLFIVAGSGWGGPRSLRKTLHAHLKILRLEKLSAFFLFWVRSRFRVRSSVIRELIALREEGLTDNIGLSIHKRRFAHDLYRRNIFDIFMLRYNAAHRGLEEDFLERLDPTRLPGILTYTATRWGKLLVRPPGWDGPLPRPGDLYRFQLSHPRVTATWMAVAGMEELEANLGVIAEGPLSPDELSYVRRFGDTVHAMKTPLLGNLFERSSLT